MNAGNLKNNPKKNDIIIISSIIIIGVIGLILYVVFGKTGNYVQVRVDGEIVESFDLNNDAIVVIDGVEKSSNTLVIKDGTAHIENATCPDKLCENMGRIKTTGQSIVCLPNKVVVEIVADSTSPEKLDGVVG